MIFAHNLDLLERFFSEIGERYVNLVVDEAGLAVPSAYCAYLSYTGRTGCVLLIDGGNSFNPYLVTHYARLFSVDERSVMDRIKLSRAFTCHQMSALLGEHLETVVAEFGAEAIVISDPACLYVERSAEEDVLEEFLSAYGRLLDVTYSGRLTTLILHSSRMPRFLEGGALEEGRRERAARCIEGTLSRLADSIYRLEERPEGFNVNRVKHPCLPEGPVMSIARSRGVLTLDVILGQTEGGGGVKAGFYCGLGE